MSKHNFLTTKEYPLIALRLAIGCIFFYSGITKIFDSQWSALGYLQNANTFSGFYNWLASPFNIGWVNFLNEWGLTLIGLSLILGLWVRTASYFGILIMLLYYFPVLNFPFVGDHSFLIDEHIIYALSLWFIDQSGVGKILSLENIIKTLDFKTIYGAFAPSSTGKSSASGNESKSSKKNKTSKLLNAFSFSNGNNLIKNLILFAFSVLIGFKITIPLVNTILEHFSVKSDLILIIFVIIVLIVLSYLISRTALHFYAISREVKLKRIFIYLLISFILLFASTEYQSTGFAKGCYSINSEQKKEYIYGGWPVETILIDSPDPVNCNINKTGPIINFIFWLTMITAVSGLITRDSSYWSNKNDEK